MLQQTTVAAVVPRYAAFLLRFPSLRALAAAPEDEVLAAWSGLGYYRRARDLHRGARHLVERRRGVFPRDAEAARAVPGVGPYTAGAVLSIACGMPLPVVDGNVRRVLARLQGLSGERCRTDAAYQEEAEALLCRESPGDWNQALMELGATVCTPRRPGCSSCPLRRPCRARAGGVQEQLPEPRRRREPVTVAVAAAVVERRGRYLLVRRGDSPLLGRLWELPQTPLDAPAPDLARELRVRHGLHVSLGPPAARVRHAITFRRIRLEARRARLLGPLPPVPGRFRWASREEARHLPVSSLTLKVLDGLGPAGRARGGKAVG